MPRHPASPPPSPIWAPSCASRRSRFPGSTRPRCSAAPRRSPRWCEGTGLFDTRRDPPRRDPRDADEIGQPAVLATRAARNGRPTILLYAHHDVQPVGDEALWESAPFEPTVRDGRLYGRGAADDKAGVMAHVAALRALKEALGADFDLGVALFIEGEEEAGSRSFAQFLADNADALRADVIVVADSGNWDARTPALTVSLRGNTRFTLRVRTLEHASHSGMFGGAVPDAMMATVKLLATLWDEDGAVAVDGLDRTGCRDAGVQRGDAARRGGAAGRGQPDRHAARSSAASGTSRSITVTGIDAPSVANASNTLSPEIAVVISARVAPGQPRAGGLRRDRGAPARARAVRRAADLQRPGLRRRVPRRHERLGRRDAR